MKKFLYALSLVMTVLSFASCEKQKEPSELLVGNWLCEKIEMNFIEDGIAKKYEAPAYLRLSFYENGNFVFTGPDGEVENSGTWTLYGNTTITIKFAGDNDYMSWYIETLTENELVFKDTPTGNEYQAYHCTREK